VLQPDVINALRGEQIEKYVIGKFFTSIVLLVDDEPSETRLTDHGRGLDDKFVGVRRVRRPLVGGSGYTSLSSRRRICWPP